MNTLTNERLNKIASWRKTYGDDHHNVMMPAHEAEELVSRLLAAESQLAELRKQEPVAWRCMRNGPNAYVVTLSKTVADEWNSKGFPNVPLYARPVPPAASQPALDDVIKKFTEMNIGFPVQKLKADYVISWVLKNYPCNIAIQPYTVPDEWTYSDAVQFVLINGMSNETRSGIAMHVFNHCRAAMLQSSGNAEQKGKRLRIAEGRYAAYFPQERPIAGTRVIAWDEKGNLLGVGFGRDTRETGITIVINGKKYDSNHVLHWCSASMESGDSPAIPDGYCIMPLKLTAENGAKGALSGEFHISRTVTCHECGGEGCEDCNDQGSWEEEILIGWGIIKLIYQSAVDACSKTDKASS